MVEPLKITDDMRDMHDKRVDKEINRINNNIKDALDRGWTDCSFDPDEDLFDEVKSAFICAGYKISVNPWARTMYTCYKISW